MQQEWLDGCKYSLNHRGKPLWSLHGPPYSGSKDHGYFGINFSLKALTRCTVDGQSFISGLKGDLCYGSVYPKKDLKSVVQLLSLVRLFAARQAPLFSTVSWSLLKFMPTELVMLSHHIILYHPFLLLPSIFPSIRVFSNESALHIRWPTFWSFSISPSNEYSGLIFFRIDF